MVVHIRVIVGTLLAVAVCLLLLAVVNHWSPDKTENLGNCCWYCEVTKIGDLS